MCRRVKTKSLASAVSSGANWRHVPGTDHAMTMRRFTTIAIVTAASKAQAAADYLIDLANPAANDDAVPSSDAQASRQPEREAA